jgi:flagellar biosynthesis protein
MVGQSTMKKEQRTKKAAALAYDAGKDRAPKLAAKGSGIVAEKIIELAVKHGIPIRNDPALIQILSKLDIDEAIPPELYQAIAEILAFVYQMNEQRRQESSSR